MRFLASISLSLVLAGNISGQNSDLAALFEPSGGELSFLLFEQDRMLEAFLGRRLDLATEYPALTLSGDFDGNGVDELALFGDLQYTPNLNPYFSRSVVTINRSDGVQFIPSGTWFSAPVNDLNFSYVSFSLAGDYNQDGKSDIALLYNDPTGDTLHIYVLESTGSGFLPPQAWYAVDRNVFNFTALEFANTGDFNGNGKPDIAVFYNYFDTAPEAPQRVFLFESEGNSFSLLAPAYDGTRADYDFAAMQAALSGDFNLDGYSDIAVLLEDAVDQDLIIPVFEGSAGGQLGPVVYNTFSVSELDPGAIVHAAGGNFAGDSATDLALFYDHPGTGMQEILILESEQLRFLDPATFYSTDGASLPMNGITSVRSGTFLYPAMVRAALWKDDRSAALSFTFDDGYRGAFEHGGAELEAAGLKGTFYIFTDTSNSYDGELASTVLIREYSDKGHEIASHTSNHSDLGLLTGSGDLDSLNQVLSASAELLNERFDRYTMSMSIPFGSFRYETLEHISQYFYSARSSQFGFNLATPHDFYALRSWPILSTTTPAYVNDLMTIAESYGTYLPLMYHDMLDASFNEDSLIYTYRREHFRTTLQNALSRDLWIASHEDVYKYIRERNALKVSDMDSAAMHAQPGHFSFVADDGLADSIFNMELTLKIALPLSWIGDTVSIGQAGDYEYLEVQQDSSGKFIHFNWLPSAVGPIAVHEGRLAGTGFPGRIDPVTGIGLTAAPNPFLHETLISVPGNNYADSYLIIRDIQGRIVRDLRVHSEQNYRLLRQELAPGIYIIQLVQAGRQIASLKLVAL